MVDTSQPDAKGAAPRPFNIMAKPVCGVCNLACGYCYYLGAPGLYDGVDPAEMRMSDEVLESFVRQYMAAQPQHVDFGFQGGEPTLAGLEFFRRAVQFQQRWAQPGQEIANALQTNGTLLDDDWGRFLAANRFLVGVSLDGPAAWHDHFRRDRAGEGSFARAWRGLELLRRHRVEFNVLVTLNSRNVLHAGDLYRYFVNRGIDWLQFIPICEVDAAGAVAAYCPTGRQYGRFLCEVFDIWARHDVGRVSVRLFDSVLHALVHGVGSTCCQSQRCANAHVLEFNGDLYACDHFVQPRWRIGNILQTPLTELLSSPRLAEFDALKTDLPASCRDCEHLAYCWGGCPKHRVGAEGENRFCQGYRMFFDHALPTLRRLAEDVRRGRPPRPAAAQPARPRPTPDRKPGRNSPCPCGSGRKFKQCCGRR